MRSRQFPVAAVPSIWLFADPRLGDGLWTALARLPRGSGVVLRGHPEPQRVAAIARRRGLLLVEESEIAKAHNRAELIRARRTGARLVFVSPVFATRTHPGARALGAVRFGLMVRGSGVPVAALGGMTAKRFRRLTKLGAVAWGAIDAFGQTAPQAKPTR
ncbi:thiamine phosphate synthase [Glacieibacterium sp.]|uniref:thiamine phosphate synthase n=1 Tax=Glacieibacterium sp. TaxID=2860237 RepID=UPI003B003970